MNESSYEKKSIRDVTFYNVNWSGYLNCEKFNILKKLTDMTGIYVVFEVNEYKRLSPILLGGAWFTGLRTTTLKLFNPTSVDPIPKELLRKISTGKTYLKYLEIYILDDYQNIFSKLKEIYQSAHFDTNGSTSLKELTM